MDRYFARNWSWIILVAPRHKQSRYRVYCEAEKRKSVGLQTNWTVYVLSVSKRLKNQIKSKPHFVVVITRALYNCISLFAQIAPINAARQTTRANTQLNPLPKARRICGCESCFSFGEFSDHRLMFVSLFLNKDVFRDSATGHAVR